jgi:predicted CopG family antitoxin
MARSRTHTKTIAITPDQHEKLKKLQSAYKTRLLADVLEILLIKNPPEGSGGN